MREIMVERLQIIAERHEVKRVLDAYRTLYNGRPATPLMKQVYLAAAIRQTGTDLSIDTVSKRLDQLITKGQFPAVYAVKEDLIEAVSDGDAGPGREDEEPSNRLDKFKKKKKSGFKSFVKKGKPDEREDKPSSKDDEDQNPDEGEDGKKPTVKRDKGGEDDEDQYQSKDSQPQDRDAAGQSRGIPRKKDEEEAAEDDASKVTISRTEIIDKKKPTETDEDEDDDDEPKGKTLIRINPKEETDIIKTEWFRMMRAKRNR